MKWQFQDHDECPLCNQSETPEHVLLCQDPRAITTWSTALKKLETWMTARRTNPELQRIVLTRLREWHDQRPLSSPPILCDFKPAIASQDFIGWYPFLLGHVSNHWRGIQQAYYEWLGRRNTGKKWIKLLIQQLFNVSWDMWEHRNAIKHNTPTAAKLREIQALDVDIRQEFSTGSTNLLPRDVQWFKHPSETIITSYSIQEKKQWLTSVAHARFRWARRRELERSSQNSSRTLLRNWLIPIPPPQQPQQTQL